jgi:hypothetical protein
LEERLSTILKDIDIKNNAINECRRNSENADYEMSALEKKWKDDVGVARTAYEDGIAELKKQMGNLKVRLENDIQKINHDFESRKKDIQNRKQMNRERIEMAKETMEKYERDRETIKEEIDLTPRKSMSELDSELLELKVKVRDLMDYDELKKRWDRLNQKEQAYMDVKERHKMEDAFYKYFAYDLPRKLIERAELPVDGVEFLDDGLYVNGRHIDRMSSAERSLVVVKLAVAMAKSRGHIAVAMDGVENLDDEHQRDFMEAIKNADIRVLYTRHGQPKYDHEILVEKNQ